MNLNNLTSNTFIHRFYTAWTRESPVRKDQSDDAKHVCIKTNRFTTCYIKLRMDIIVLIYKADWTFCFMFYLLFTYHHFFRFKSLSLSLSLSLYLSIYLSIALSLPPSFRLSLTLSSTLSCSLCHSPTLSLFNSPIPSLSL